MLIQVWGQGPYLFGAYFSTPLPQLEMILTRADRSGDHDQTARWKTHYH